MTTNALDRLLTTLAVQLHAFAVCQIEAGWRLKMDPMDAIVIHYILSGEGTIRAGNGSEAPFAPHSIIVVPAGVPQSLGAPTRGGPESTAGEQCEMLADGLVRFTAGNGLGGITCVCGSITASYAGALGLFDHLDRPIVADTGADDPLRQFFAIMLDEIARSGFGARAVTESLMKLCLVTLLRRHLIQAGSDSPFFLALHDRRLAEAVSAIVARPAESHTVASLAEIAGMSRSAFAEHFTRVFGRSPIDFVQAVRLRHAAHLLRTTDLPVKVISGVIGYSSRSHFSRAFRSFYEADPSTFRRMSSTAREEDLQIAPVVRGAAEGDLRGRDAGRR